MTASTRPRPGQHLSKLTTAPSEAGSRDSSAKKPTSVRALDSRRGRFSADPEPAVPAAEAGSGAAALTDEELAWKLYQELNAEVVPATRTRNRRQPDFFVPPKEARKRGAGDPVQQQQQPVHVVGQSSPPFSGGSDAAEQYGAAPGGSKRGGARAGGKQAAAPPLAAEPGTDSDEHLSERSSDAKVAAAVADEQQRVAAAAVELGATADAAATAGPSSSQAGQSRGTLKASGDRQPAVHSAPAPSAAAKREPAAEAPAAVEPASAGPAAAAGAEEKPGPRAQQERPAARPVAAGAGRTAAAAGTSAPAKQQGSGRAAGAKPLRVPKLPMVRLGSKWYRCRTAKDAGERVLMEFAGFEELLPAEWLPRDSDRIWRGSYKGKDWKHLGEGAWAPKTKDGSAGNSGGFGAGRKRGRGRQHAAPGASGSGGAGGSSCGGHEGSGSDDEEHEGPPPAESAEPGAAAGAAPAARKRGAHGEAGSTAAAGGEEATQPAPKKARMRKRLDPIVREALRAAEQGGGEEGTDEEQQVEAVPAVGHSTPQSAAARWRSGDAQRMAGAGAAQTPTPETPLTRLTQRKSTTPGMQPLSPRKAAALAAGECAAPLSPRARRAQAAAEHGEGAPLSPRRRRAAVATDASEGEGEASDMEEEAYGRRVARRRARRAAAQGSDSDEGGAGSQGDAYRGSSGAGSQDEGAGGGRAPRPRRVARRAAIYAAADFLAFEETSDRGHMLLEGAAFGAASAHPAAAAAAQQAAAEPAGPPQPARRRRKPLVACAAPTDVGVSAHAVLARAAPRTPVDPYSPRALPAGMAGPSGRQWGQPEAAARAAPVDDVAALEEADLLAAPYFRDTAALMPLPVQPTVPPLAAAAAAAAAAQQHPKRRASIAGGPLGVASGRVAKHAAGPRIKQSGTAAWGEDASEVARRRGGVPSGPRAFFRSFSAPGYQRDHPLGGSSAAAGGRRGRAGGPAALSKRSLSLDSLAAVQHMFGPLLGALGTTAGGSSASAAAAAAGPTRPHLFSKGCDLQALCAGTGSGSSAQYAKSILALKAELFSCCAATASAHGGGAASNSSDSTLSASPSGLTALLEAHTPSAGSPKACPPLPLFC